MKTIIYTLVAIILSITLHGQSKNVPVTQANIKWTGHKVIGEHYGTIQLKKGTLVMNKGAIKGGKFIIDMNTINTTDIEGDGKTKLDQHLKSADFFDTKNYPEAILTFTKIKKIKTHHYRITANLEIKNKTEPITFDLFADKGKGTSKLSIDRTQYGIQYGSGSFFEDLGNRAISDQFDIEVIFYY